MSILPTLFNYEKTRTGLHSQKLVHKDWDLEQNQKKDCGKSFRHYFFDKETLGYIHNLTA